MIKKYIPDSPEEIKFIAKSIQRLGTAMSVIMLFQESKSWALTSLILTWVGFEVSEYISLHDRENEKGKDKRITHN